MICLGNLIRKSQELKFLNSMRTEFNMILPDMALLGCLVKRRVWIDEAEDVKLYQNTEYQNAFQLIEDGML